MSTPRVSVVIPTWNGAAMLRSALMSLKAQTWRDHEVIVVDNGSTDSTTAMLAREWPAVRLIRFEDNRGFAAAVNAGIRSSRSELVVLMNNDVEAEPHWLRALVDAMDRHPGAGACASKMLSFADPTRIDSAGDTLDWLAFSIGHREPDGPAFNEERYVLSACAGAAAYRRAALDDAGLFDERFFAYLEDVDLGVRLQLCGWRCVYVPSAVVLHHGSATADRMPDVKLRLLMRNSLFIFFQYMPTRELALRGPVILFWPFYRSFRERRSLAPGWRALADACADLRAILRRRASAHAARRITPAEFRSLLGHAGTPAVSR